MPRHMFGKKIDEAKWSQAKAQAEKEGKGGNYAYITSIYKSMAHSEKSMEIQSASELLKAIPTTIKIETKRHTPAAVSSYVKGVESAIKTLNSVVKDVVELRGLEGSSTLIKSYTDFKQELQFRLSDAINGTGGATPTPSTEGSVSFELLKASDLLADVDDERPLLVILSKAKYTSRKKVNGKWVYKYAKPADIGEQIRHHVDEANRWRGKKGSKAGEMVRHHTDEANKWRDKAKGGKYTGAYSGGWTASKGSSVGREHGPGY